MIPGEYFVGANPQAWNPSLSNCKDHTTGTGNNAFGSSAIQGGRRNQAGPPQWKKPTGALSETRPCGAGVPPAP